MTDIVETPQNEALIRFQQIENFAKEAWDIIDGPSCNVDITSYDLENIADVKRGLSDQAQAESFLTTLEAHYRRHLVALKAFERNAENLFGIFFRRDFLPDNPRIRGMSQKLLEQLAQEFFTEKYGYSTTNILDVSDFYTELGKIISSKHQELKNLYWVFKDSIKALELMYQTYNTGIPSSIPRGSTSSGSSEYAPIPAAYQAQMPRVASGIPQPAAVPAPLPPGFATAFHG